MLCKHSLYHLAMSVCVCLSVTFVNLCVCLSVTFVNSVKMNKRSIKVISPSGSHTILVSPYQTGWRYSNGNLLTGTSNAGGVGRAYIWLQCLLLTLQQTRRCQHGSPVNHGHRPASCDTSLVVSGGVDCGRRRRNVYVKKPQRYAKDNRTAHLTACSDKSVAYVTNNKRLLHVLYCSS